MTTTKQQNVVGKYFPIFKSAIARLFLPNQKMPAQTKITPQHTPATRAQLADEIHWCNHERHGMFPVPREFLTRGCSDSGRHFSVFQCGDKSCKEFVAVIINNKHPENNWILFRGQNFCPRPERRPAPRTPFKPVRAASAAA
jgi:hypothetical protein